MNTFVYYINRTPKGTLNIILPRFYRIGDDNTFQYDSYLDACEAFISTVDAMIHSDTDLSDYDIIKLEDAKTTIYGLMELYTMNNEED